MRDSNNPALGSVSGGVDRDPHFIGKRLGGLSESLGSAQPLTGRTGIQIQHRHRPNYTKLFSWAKRQNSSQQCPCKPAWQNCASTYNYIPPYQPKIKSIVDHRTQVSGARLENFQPNITLITTKSKAKPNNSSNNNNNKNPRSLWQFLVTRSFKVCTTPLLFHLTRFELSRNFNNDNHMPSCLVTRQHFVALL